MAEAVGRVAHFAEMAVKDQKVRLSCHEAAATPRG
uniref:Uncharacterized protein n=1 Tax=Ralstonia solanacearum TaxID=305 RepID=A0A0S4WSC5_RALSL|nr:protein of unknown function [Ralstonia solanacearum]CUV54488.1 protein of unknown function [Ralstonia solanacearum]